MGIIRKLSVSVLGLALVAGLCLGLLGLGTSPASAKSSKLKRSWVVRTGWLGAKTTVTRTYNSKGLLKTRTNVCKENNISDNWKYTYEYDKKGRYVKRRFSNEDDAQQRRTYTYGDIKGSKSLYQMTLNLDERLLLGNTERNQM